MRETNNVLVQLDDVDKVFRRGSEEIHVLGGAHLEVPEAPVHEPRRSAAGATREIGLVDDRGPDPAHGRVPRNAGAGDPAADDQQVDGPGGHGGDVLRTGAVRERSVH